jgi:hypothetical protein
LVTENFKKVGLDPKQIKYVILHHAVLNCYFALSMSNVRCAMCNVLGP